MIDRKWLATCATAGEFLYGQYTVTVLKKMYERRKGCTISTENLIRIMQELQKSGMVLMEYVPGRLEEDDDDYGFFLPFECEGTSLESVMRKADADGNPYASLHLDENERTNLLAETPDDLEYYVPNTAEIEQLVEEGYIRTPAMTALEDEIKKLGGDPAFLIPLWSQISTDKMDSYESIQEIMNMVFPAAAEQEKEEKTQSGKSTGVPTMDDLDRLISFINEYLNHINLRSRRGWRPDDLFKKMYPDGLESMPAIMPGSVASAKLLKEAEPELRAMGAMVDYSSLDNYVTAGQYGERRVIKVGRNDPCPCGSGKKYKRCHGAWNKTTGD